jgi:non-ribosomal peptide synthetase component E (peptide arylation enzyme)
MKDDRKIAKITPNGFIKFYNADNTPCQRHDKSFYRAGDELQLKKDGYKVVFG